MIGRGVGPMTHKVCSNVPFESNWSTPNDDVTPTYSIPAPDFGVNYDGRENAQHLVGNLRAHYQITEEWVGSQYIGLAIDWDNEARTFDISIPVTLNKSLSALPSNSRHAHRIRRICGRHHLPTAPKINSLLQPTTLHHSFPTK